MWPCWRKPWLRLTGRWRRKLPPRTTTMPTAAKKLCCWFRTIWASSICISPPAAESRSEEHTSELQSHSDLHSFPTRRSSDLAAADHDHADRRKEALLLVSYNLGKLNLHLTSSGRILNDLRTLKHLLLKEPGRLAPS